MRYKDISWNLEIDCSEEITDSDLEIIAEQIKNDYRNGTFTTDCTDYEKFEELKKELEDKLGREIYCNIWYNDKGELEDLLQIAVDNNDNEIEELINELLEIGFDN